MSILRQATSRAIHLAWTSGFAIAGLLPRTRRVSVLAPTGGSSIAVVAPHPDDETIGCGRAMMQHLAAGDSVTVLVVTDGGRSRGASSQQRAGEARDAAAVLGGTWHFGGFPEGSWDAGGAAAWLQGHLTALSPRFLYAPSCIDYHPEHLRTALVVAGVLARLPVPPPQVRVYEIGVPLTPMLVNVIAASSPASAKVHALSCYASQRGTIAAASRLHRYDGVLFRVRGDVEVFWEMDADAYVRVIRAGDWSNSTTPFYGVRGRPFTDPLPYTIGRRERRRLLAVSS
jgi:LmbE family N-acetylglucosaminyl deacetylase